MTKDIGAPLVRPDGDISRRGLLKAAAALGGGLALPGLGWAQGAGEPFKIGWVRPTTGRLASSFAPLYAGGVIAIDEINAAGGIMGRPIVRDEQDDEASPAKEPGIILKYQGAGIHFVCGPTGSSQALASLSATTARKMIQTTYGLAADMGNGRKYPYHYQLIFNSDQQAVACVSYLTDVLKLKKIGILQESTAYGEQITPVSKAELKKRGLDPVDVQVFPITAPDLSGYVQALRKAGAEGILMWMSTVPNAAMIFNAMNAMKWFPPITGHTSLFLESLLDLVPREALTNVYGTWYKSLTWTATESPAPRQVEYAKKILAAPDAKGSEINAAGSPYYDFLHLLKMAIEQEKSFDVERVKAVLDSTKGYKGMLGTLSFTPEQHCGIDVADLVMATVTSAREPKAMGIFRERAPG
ncbi:ABC transporter substrate-binding protein [Chelatococcus reniformis]|uniref:Leucine-binding protein domain-containing protein n=1 Tax=Chelatococcus reniformis TaxID=1494448 RepID=A0A916UST1_9HYPH|nr:ABC transporter substrate-binding protein [Chelatococcus reniformis]GGC86594.1 hypothetical protein GCM10010994_50650 [Chelatococcus reniformis]